ncbi:S9 family peptidase [soil metagenome]
MPTLTPEALWSIPRVGAPHPLADGRLLVPVTTHGDADSPEVVVWRVDPTCDTAHIFASGSISSISVSDEAATVVFLRPVDGTPQVHVQPLDGGEARPVTDLPLGAIGAKWASDGQIVAIAVVRADSPTLEETLPRDPEADPEVGVTEDAVFRYWDMWLHEVYHPVLIDPESGAVTDLTPGATRLWAWPNTDSPLDDVDVSPDGRLVAFAADDSDPPHVETSWSIFLVESDGSNLRRVDAGRVGNSRRPRFTSDGSGLVYGYRPQPDFYADRVQLVRHDLNTGADRDLAPDWDRSPEHWLFDEADRLLFTAEHRGRSCLWRHSGDEGDVEQLTDGGWVTDPAVSPDGTIYVLAQSLTAPPEVHHLGGPGGDGNHALVPVTSFTEPAMSSVTLGHARDLTVEGADFESVQVWVIDPPGSEPGARLPLVHMIHGGPHGVFGDMWHWRWNAQVVAASGRRVAHVNFHGSTGWGSEFASSIHGAWEDKPFRDVEAATDHLIGLGLVDENAMAVTGGSYGGYLTAWITTQTDRYSCAVAHAPVTNLGGMYSSDVVFGWGRATGADIWTDRDAVDRWSPSAHASGYRTPTLVTAGARDYRVPETQAIELYGVLKAKGVPARLVVYPEENHWIMTRRHSIHWYRELQGWLDRWMSQPE